MANLAGVSRSAVSLVLNDRADGFLAKETQLRIQAAAAQLGYTPNHIARSLRNQRSRVIGLVSNNAVTGPFDGAIIAGANATAHKAGFMIFATDTEDYDDNGAAATKSLLERSVDGLIRLTVGLHETTVLDSFLTLPAALANCYPSADSPESAASLPAFIPDEVAGGHTAAQHLIGLGHTRIAFLGGEYDSPASSLREQGFRQAMREANLAVHEPWVLEAGFGIAEGYRSAMRVLDAPAAARPTAVLAANDRAAVGITLAAARLRLQVPADLSIVGYDDESLIADATVPSLTTMALPFVEMGSRAMEAVLARIEPGAAPAEPPSGKVLLPCRLVVRESTAPTAG